MGRKAKRYVPAFSDQQGNLFFIAEPKMYATTKKATMTLGQEHSAKFPEERFIGVIDDPGGIPDGGLAVLVEGERRVFYAGSVTTLIPSTPIRHSIHLAHEFFNFFVDTYVPPCIICGKPATQHIMLSGGSLTSSSPIMFYAGVCHTCFSIDPEPQASSLSLPENITHAIIDALSHKYQAGEILPFDSLNIEHQLINGRAFRKRLEGKQLLSKGQGHSEMVCVDLESGIDLSKDNDLQRSIVAQLSDFGYLKHCYRCGSTSIGSLLTYFDRYTKGPVSRWGLLHHCPDCARLLSETGQTEIPQSVINNREFAGFSFADGTLIRGTFNE